MQEQIQYILKSEELSSSQFADKIGVQRSSVSHVLSGRNKPGFDFIQKILRAFPNLDADWLITGDGEMYKKRRGGADLFDGPFSETSPAQDERRLSARVESAGLRDIADKKTPEPSREVERVIVFYSDKTFREYRSE